MGRHYQFLVLFILLVESSIIVFEPSLIIATIEQDKFQNETLNNQIKNLNIISGAETQSINVHPNSIDGFKETSQDDTLIYSDQFFSSKSYYATNGSTTHTVINNHTSTHNLDGVYFATSGDGEIDTVAININFTFLQQYSIDGFKIDLFGGANVSSECALYLYDFKHENWHNYDTMISGLSWSNRTIFRSTLWINNTICLMVVGPSEKSILLVVDFVQVQLFFLTINDGNYAESFSDSSDWSLIDSISNSASSFATVDEDILDFEFSMFEADDSEGIYTREPSLNGIDYYFEFRFYLTNNLYLDCIEIEFHDDDNVTSSKSSSYICDTLPVTWTTIKFHVSSIPSVDIANIEAISIKIIGNPGASANFRCDYIRISHGDDMGWQHDGSTTTGIIEEPHDGWKYHISSDGDKLNITMERNGGTSIFGCVWVLFDITSENSNLELDYYQFAEMVFEIPQNPGLYWIFIPHIDGKTAGDESQAIGSFFWGEKPETKVRTNLAALNRSIWSQSGIRIIWYCSSSNGKSTCLIDYIKIYSILNFTVTQTNSKPNDLLYTEGSILICEADSTIFEISLDPILAIDTVVYNIIEIDRTEFLTETSYALNYWSPWNPLAIFSMDEGILRSIRLRLTEFGIIRSVKFRSISSEELLNQPRITFVAVLPSNPNTHSEVSIYCGVEGLNIQYVIIRALVFPNEYESNNYTLSETQLHVWTIVFDTMQEGYYYFMISVVSRYGKASGYVPLTVTEYQSNSEYPGFMEWQVAFNSWLIIGFMIIFVTSFYWIEKRLREMREELANLKTPNSTGLLSFG